MKCNIPKEKILFLLKKLFTEKDFMQIANGLSGSMLFSDALKKKQPLAYWLCFIWLFVVCFLPATLFCVWCETAFESAINPLCSVLSGATAIIGIVATLGLGIALVNEAMRLLHGYLGWKVTLLFSGVGLPVAALCVWLLKLMNVAKVI